MEKFFRSLGLVILVVLAALFVWEKGGDRIGRIIGEVKDRFLPTIGWETAPERKLARQIAELKKSYTDLEAGIARQAEFFRADNDKLRADLNACRLATAKQGKPVAAKEPRRSLRPTIQPADDLSLPKRVKRTTSLPLGCVRVCECRPDRAAQAQAAAPPRAMAEPERVVPRPVPPPEAPTLLAPPPAPTLTVVYVDVFSGGKPEGGVNIKINFFDTSGRAMSSTDILTNESGRAMAEMPPGATCVRADLDPRYHNRLPRRFSHRDGRIVINIINPWIDMCRPLDKLGGLALVGRFTLVPPSYY